MPTKNGVGSQIMQLSTAAVTAALTEAYIQGNDREKEGRHQKNYMRTDMRKSFPAF